MAKSINDSSGRAASIGLLATVPFLMSCVSGPPSIAPVGLSPVEAVRVESWIDGFAPRAARLYTIRPWRYRNERGAAAGRAAIRVAPPDSLRFDYQGPFRKSGKAAVVGDSALWVTPEDDFRALVSLAPLFWVALGIPQSPPAGTAFRGLEREDLRVWQYVTTFGDTVSFIARGSPTRRLEAEIRRQGRTIGYARADIDPITHLPLSARIDLPIDVSRFEFTIESVDTLVTFDAAIWQPQG